jgi:hypothetical protein
MRGRMSYDPVRLPNGARIHLFKVDRGSLEGEREAHRIATKLRERLFAAHRPPDVVIMEGEPGENPRLFGTDESVAQIRSMLSAIAQHLWAPVQFEHQS